MRQAARKDANHNEIAWVLGWCGCSVADTSQLGSGFPDIVVGYAARNYLFEIKNREGRNRVEKDELKFMCTWRGQTHIVYNVFDAGAVIGLELRSLEEASRHYAESQKT